MATEEIKLALPIPQDVFEEIKQRRRDGADGASMEVKAVPPGERPKGELGFDPVTGSVLLWVAFKFVGKAAVTSAVSLLMKEIYEALKRRAKEKTYPEVEVRFPDGTTLRFSVNAPLSSEKLEQAIKEHGKV